MSNASSSGRIQPDDPRYESWLFISAFLQGEDSGARAEFLSSCQKNGEIQLADVLRLCERSFDGCAKAIVITVNGTVSAERRAQDLDQLLESLLEQWKEWFQAVERITGIAAGHLETQTRLRLTTRRDAWKAEAFQFAVQSEIARISKLPKSEPAPPPAADGLVPGRIGDTSLVRAADVVASPETEQNARAKPERKIDPALVQNAHVDLLLKIVDKKNISIETWVRDHKLSRTVLFDWKAAREAGKSLKGKVSNLKSNEIEKAIEDDAKALGLATRTRSD